MIKYKKIVKNVEEVRELLKKTLRGLFTIIGIILGYNIAKEVMYSNWFLKSIYLNNNEIKILFIQFLCMLVFGLILYIISPWINIIIIRAMDYFEKSIQKFSANEILFGTVGAITGLTISTLFVNLLSSISIVGPVIALLVATIMAAFGVNISNTKREDLLTFFTTISLKRSNTSNIEKVESAKGSAKILDTSVIIDGRLLDISKTGFIEGTLIIPIFVLQELRQISDSSDILKRNRGRRGLDILNKIQKDLIIDVEICEQDFPGLSGVDSKVLKLAQVLNCKVLTIDYNLNKIAEFQGIPVLNINEFANAIKPVVLPGEAMQVKVIKNGTELNQGVAYLDDGTMVVVESGKNHIGELLGVIVTSVRQTAAGNMIFAKRNEVV